MQRGCRDGKNGVRHTLVAEDVGRFLDIQIGPIQSGPPSTNPALIRVARTATNIQVAPLAIGMQIVWLRLEQSFKGYELVAVPINLRISQCSRDIRPSKLLGMIRKPQRARRHLQHDRIDNSEPPE